jgi:hypothetical protein
MPPPVSGAIILTGTYGVFGANASGSVTLQDIYYVPIAGLSDAYYEYNYSQSYDVPTNPSGSSTFQVQVPFAAAAVVVGFEANATVSTASDASDDYSSSGLDPHFTVVMPDGGTYTSASGVDYSELPGTTIPEPATLTLLGLGLTGLVAKIARRQCR